VVVLVPIAVRVPAVVVFVPPLMPLTPATLPRVVQFTTLVICLAAVASVSVNRLGGVHAPHERLGTDIGLGLLPAGAARRRKAETLRERPVREPIF